jgi:hypothetical protein
MTLSLRLLSLAVLFVVVVGGANEESLGEKADERAAKDREGDPVGRGGDGAPFDLRQQQNGKQ